jgi:predicted ATPase
VLRTYTPPAPPPPKPIKPPEDEDDVHFGDENSSADERREKQKTELAMYEANLNNYEASVRDGLAKTPRGMYIHGEVGTGKRYGHMSAFVR